MKSRTYEGMLKRLGAVLVAAVLMLSMIPVDVMADNVLKLPSALKVIEEEAFADNNALEEVIVPKGTTRINARAFADCNLSKVSLSTTVSYIAPNAFNGNSGMLVDANENSYAYEWALDHGFDVNLGTVSKLNGSVRGHTVVLTWNAGRSYDGYRISTIENGENLLLGTVTNAASYTIANVSTGKHTYYVAPYATIQGGTKYGNDATVTVTVKNVPVESIELSDSYASLKIGNTKQLTATVLPEIADNRALNWESSNTAVATVSKGKVTAVSGGNAVIYATAKDGSHVQAVCFVSVDVDQPYLTVTHPLIGNVLSGNEIEMHNGVGAYQTWTINSNYASRIEKVGDWFSLSATSFTAGESTLRLTMTDYAPSGTKNTGKVKFYINDSLFVTVNVFQSGIDDTPIMIDPTITVNHPTLGDIFNAGTIDMFNGTSHQTWTVTANCDWTITKSGSWYTIDDNVTGGNAGTKDIVIRIPDCAPAGTTRTGSITFKVNGNTYKTVNFRQVGEDKSLTVSHAIIGDVLNASSIEMHNGSSTQNWTIVSNAAWTIKKSGTWFTLDQTSGSANNEDNPTTNLKITVNGYVSAGDYREGIISFYFGSTLYKRVTIYQEGEEEEIDTTPEASISVSHPLIGDISRAKSVNIGNSTGLTQTWTVLANYNWTVSASSNDWFSINQEAGSAGQATALKITTTDYARSGDYNVGYISFYKNGTRQLRVKLYQGEDYQPADVEVSYSISHPELGNILDQEKIYLHNNAGAEMNWTVRSNVDWRVEGVGSWFRVSPSSGSANTTSNQSSNIKITTTDYARTGKTNNGYIKFYSMEDGQEYYIKIPIAQYGGASGQEEPIYADKLTVSHPHIGDVLAAGTIEMHNGTPSEQNWKITSNKAWRVTTTGDWFSVSPTSGSANTESNPTTNMKITITDWARAGANNTGTIKFYLGGSLYKTVNVFQDGGASESPSMTLGSSEFGDVLALETLTLPYQKKEHQFALKANRAWSVSKTGTWFTVSPGSGSTETEYTLKVTVTSLPATGATNTGSITFKLDGATYKTVRLKVTNPDGIVVTPEDTKLTAPTGLKATNVTATSVQVTWNAVTGASSYNVYRSVNPTSGFTKINSTGAKSPYTDTTMKEGVEYYYIVAAISSNGVIGSSSEPLGPVSFNTSCALNPGTLLLSFNGSDETKSITVGKHGSNNFTVSLIQYNSSGDLCDNVVTEDDHRKAEWLQATKSGSTVTLTAAKNYSGGTRSAVLTLKCACGAEHTVIVQQNSGEDAPASVEMKLDGYNGFTAKSTVKGKAVESHLDYVLAPKDTITVSATGGARTRRLTVRVISPANKVVKTESFTTEGSGGVSGTVEYTLPSTASGAYTIKVYASNSTLAGADGQYIDAGAQIYVGVTTSLTKTLDVHRYTQGDSRWGSQYINDNAPTLRTIANAGCAMTCVAMAERFRKNDVNITPLTIKATYKFTNPSGTAEGNNINWDNYSGISGSPISDVNVMNKCYKNINAGKPSIIGLNTNADGSGDLHYVLVYGYQNLDPNHMTLSAFLVKDPAGENRKNLAVVAQTYKFKQVLTYSGDPQVSAADGVTPVTQYITFESGQSINNEWLGSDFIAKGGEVTSTSKNGTITDKTGYILQTEKTINIPFSTDVNASKVTVLLASVDQRTTYASAETTSLITSNGQKIGNIRLTIPKELITGNYLIILTSQKSASGNPDVKAMVKIQVSGVQGSYRLGQLIEGYSNASIPWATHSYYSSGWADGVTYYTCHDVKLAEGKKVKAPASGYIVCEQWYTTINNTKYLTSLGNCVKFYADDGYILILAHLSKFNFDADAGVAAISSTNTKPQSGKDDIITYKKKQRVSAGDVLGFTGNTGNSSEPHLHVELWTISNSYVKQRYLVCQFFKNGELVKEGGSHIN